jgi:hypothetical protein
VADKRHHGHPEGPLLKSLGGANADLGPGETTTLSLKLEEKTRENARKALKHRGKNVPEWSPQAEVIVYATNAAGNRANRSQRVLSAEPSRRRAHQVPDQARAR